MITHVFRTDRTNVGDWYCSPKLYFDLGCQDALEILDSPSLPVGSDVIVGGGGLVAATFSSIMESLVAQRARLHSLVAWGIGESLRVDRGGGIVAPWTGPLPDYLERFDLVGLRDFGTKYRWVPCASCMHDLFDLAYQIEHPAVIYEHKRIPIAIAGLPRLRNDGSNLATVLNFLGSAELVITNSYHGAYWATLLGRRVIAIPNMSKMYRMKHAPVIARPDQWQDYVNSTTIYPDALAECRAANRDFYADVRTLIDEGSSVSLDHRSYAGGLGNLRIRGRFYVRKQSTGDGHAVIDQLAGHPVELLGRALADLPRGIAEDAALTLEDMAALRRSKGAITRDVPGPQPIVGPANMARESNPLISLTGKYPAKLERDPLTSANVICYANRSGGGSAVIDALAESLGCRKIFAEDGYQTGVPVVWGVLRDSKEIIDEAARRGESFYYVDHAYFDHGHVKSYRITRDRFEAGAVRYCPFDRLEALKIEVSPWRSGGRSIIVCPPSDYFNAAHDCHSWLEETLAEIKKHTDRPIIIRTENGSDPLAPLPDVLTDAHALVTHSANVAVKAAVMGTPVFVSEGSAARPIGLSDLGLIEAPIRPRRNRWLAHLAYSQFSFEEMVSGEVWNILRAFEHLPFVD